MITMNPAPSPGQHGHHQAAAVLATEAFDAAADPARFPEQLKKEGLHVWQARKLYFGGGENGRAAMIDVTKPLPGGATAADFAAKGASEHRSQGFGGFANSPWMRRPAMFSLAKSVVPFAVAEDDLFRGLPVPDGKVSRASPPAPPGQGASLAVEFVPRPAVAAYRRWARGQGIEHLSAKLVSDVPVVAGEANDVELEVRDTGPDAVSGEIQLTAPPDWRLEPATLTYQAESGKTSRIRFRLTPPALANADVELRATTRVGAATIATIGKAHPIPLAKVVRLKNVPPLDGTDAGWSDVAPHEIGPASVAEGKVRDSADSSARFRLAHDGKALFVDVDVADDVVVSNIAPDDVRGHWRSDSVEICIDPAGGAEHTLACFKVGVFPFDTTGAVRAARDADANQGPIEETAPGMRVVSKRTATGYRIQASIPLREMAIDPAAHKRAGFNVIVYDGDKRDAAPGENINKSRIAWSSRPGVQGRPEDWGRIDLE
jgi:hypothetical protein